MKWTIAGLFVTLAIGFGGYYGWMMLPPEWRIKVAGWKTNILGTVVTFAPDVITLLTYVQSIGYQWEPSPEVNIAMKVIGGAIFALRFITRDENKEDLASRGKATDFNQDGV
jgi:hypothetical protein